MANGACPRPGDARLVRLTLHPFEGILIGGALALGTGLLLGFSRVVGGAVGNDPLSLVLVALVVVVLLAVVLVLDGGSPVLSIRLLGASTLLFGTLGYALVLHRIGVRI
jgi:hypothetical protein